MNITLVGTGTAGHVYAAEALAEVLIEHGHTVNFIASEHGVENKLLSDLDLSLHTIPSKPFFRVNFFDRIGAAISFFHCVKLARRELKIIGSDLVLGFGGHVSAACILAARSLGISTAIHEANALPGFGNRLVKRLVDQIYLGNLAGNKIQNNNQVNHVGFPVRSALLKRSNKHIFDPNILRLLVLGGSNGADFLNRNVADLVQKMRSKGLAIDVTHQAGERGIEIAQAAYQKINLNVKIVGYEKNIKELYQNADFVISSAGAGTIAELCIWGIPCFLVPLAEASENHQEENAREFTKLIGQKYGKWSREGGWNIDQVSDQIIYMLEHYEDISTSMLKIATPNAAIELADDIEKKFRH